MSIHLHYAGVQLDVSAPTESVCHRGRTLTEELDGAGHEVLVSMQVQHRRISSNDLVQLRPCCHGAACVDVVSAPVRPLLLLLLLLLSWRCHCALAALHQLLQRQCNVSGCRATC